jgi:hypothetical protein
MRMVLRWSCLMRTEKGTVFCSHSIMKHEFPFDRHGISGAISVKLHGGQTLDHFCTAFIKNYDAARFQAVALRIYAGKEMIVTIFAADRANMNGASDGKKLLVRKFKLENIPAAELFKYIDAFNFTVAPADQHIEDMEVMEETVQ